MNADEVVWFDLVTDEEYPDSEVSISKRSPSRRMHGQTFRFSGSSVVVGPQDSRAGGFCPEQVGKSYLFGKIRPARSVVRGIPQRGGREAMMRQSDAQSRSCTRTALCLIPCFLHPNGSRGRAENEREYGGDDEECPSGNNGVDRAERWYRPSGDEVPDHTR